MDEHLRSLELSPAAIKRHINALQVFTALEQALIPGSRLTSNLEEQVRINQMISQKLLTTKITGTVPHAHHP